jgi:hypothetical protein
MKLTKQTLKKLIKEELDAMLHEEEKASAKVRNLPSNSGEPRYFVYIPGEGYFQTREEIFNQLQNDPTSWDLGFSGGLHKISQEAEMSVAPRLK